MHNVPRDARPRKVQWPMIRSSTWPLHRPRRKSAVNPCRILQKRFEVTCEQSSSPSSSVPRASSWPKCSSVLWRASPQVVRKFRSIRTPFFDSKSHCHKSLRGCRRTRTLLRAPVHQKQIPAVVHGRGSTVWSTCGCETSLFFFASLGQKQRPRKNHGECSPTLPSGSMRLQPLSFQHLSRH